MLTLKNGYLVEHTREKNFHEGVTEGGANFEGHVFSDKVREKSFTISSNAVSGPRGHDSDYTAK